MFAFQIKLQENEESVPCSFCHTRMIRFSSKKLISRLHRENTVRSIVPSLGVFRILKDRQGFYDLGILSKKNVVHQLLIPHTIHRVKKIFNHCIHLLSTGSNWLPTPASRYPWVLPHIYGAPIAHTSYDPLAQQLHTLEDAPPSVGDAFLWFNLQNRSVREIPSLEDASTQRIRVHEQPSGLLSQHGHVESMQVFVS
jgi:hypothetical protein